jgi:hypothetical protein
VGGLLATRRFKAVRAVKGKVIDSIHMDSDDYLEIDIRFQDGTSLGIQISPRMEIELVDLLGWKKGNSFIIRSLLR